MISSDRKNGNIMPLAVLLPRVGDLSVLGESVDFLVARIDELREMKEKGEISEEELGEEAMIQQVLQWLSVEGEKE